MKTNIIIFCSLIISLNSLSISKTDRFNTILTLHKNDSIPAPVNIEPSNGQYITDTIVNLLWYSTHPKHVYEIVYADNILFEPCYRKASKDTITTINLNIFQNKTVYWKVRAFKSLKKYSNWSDVSVFHCFEEPVPLIKEKIIAPGCRGNCSQCPNYPCGKSRREPYKQVKMINKE